MWIELLKKIFLEYHASELSLAVYRVAMGLILFFESFRIIKISPSLFGHDGIFPETNWRSWHAKLRKFTMFNWFGGNNKWVQTLMIGQCLGAIMLTLGLFTKLVTIFLFLNFISRFNRNYLVCHGGDNVAKFCLFLMIFSRIGSVYSLDHYFNISFLNPEGDWSIRLIQIQVVAIYFHTVRWKLNRKAWVDGKAFWAALDHSPHARIPAKSAAIFGRPLINATLTYSTLVMQLTLPVLLLDPVLGIYGAAVMVALHISIELFFSMKVFSYLMLAQTILFLHL